MTQAKKTAETRWEELSPRSDRGTAVNSPSVAGITRLAGYCTDNQEDFGWWPGKSGNACHIEADVVIPATTSNWAAYGISAMLAFLLKNVTLLQDTDTERRMLEACFMAGAVDGYTMTPQMSVDGTSEKASQCVVGLLHEIIGNGLMEEFVRLKLGV